jgi:hypothetical protein
MSRRPAVTLIEVLVSMFIMAIGMLALLVLFPLGAISMGQALKDDRCASTASMAENIAIAMNVRNDPTVTAGFATSSVVYVDPYGVAGGLGPVGTIPRVSVSFAVGSAARIDRWFSLPDDIAFAQSGTPDPTSGSVDRGRRYSYALLLRRLSSAPGNLINLSVVVYSGRPVGALTAEPPYPAIPVTSLPPPYNLLDPKKSFAVGQPASALTVKIGGWVLDSSGNFYRVTNISDTGLGSTVLEVTPNLAPTFAGDKPVMVMEHVAEVFDKGTSWQP